LKVRVSNLVSKRTLISTQKPSSYHSQTTHKPLSENESMSHCALQEWCLKETIYENLLCKNIEIIYHKMMIAWSITPCEISREDKYIELCHHRTSTSLHSFAQPSWKPTLQDVEDDIFMTTAASGPDHWADFEGKLMKILNNDHVQYCYPRPSLGEYLTGQHLRFVKELMDLLLARGTRLDVVGRSPTEIDGPDDTIDTRDSDDDGDSSSEADYDELPNWVLQSHPDHAAVRREEPANKIEVMEKYKKKKESCMDAMNLLDTMSSGECMKEADYLQMCNLLKELYH